MCQDLNRGKGRPRLWELSDLFTPIEASLHLTWQQLYCVGGQWQRSQQLSPKLLEWIMQLWLRASMLSGLRRSIGKILFPGWCYGSVLLSDGALRRSLSHWRCTSKKTVGTELSSISLSILQWCDRSLWHTFLPFHSNLAEVNQDPSCQTLNIELPKL